MLKIEVGDLCLVPRDGARVYQLNVKNLGGRDIVDASIRCTMFSLGWGNGHKQNLGDNRYTDNSDHINVMPGRGHRWVSLGSTSRHRLSGNSPVGAVVKGLTIRGKITQTTDEHRKTSDHQRKSRNRLRNIGSRVTTLKHMEITEFQRKRLTNEDARRLVKGGMTLVDMFKPGCPSFISVMGYGADSFSGARAVFTGRVLELDDSPIAAHAAALLAGMSATTGFPLCAQRGTFAHIRSRLVSEVGF